MLLLAKNFFFYFDFRWYRLIENQSAVSRQDLDNHPFGFDFFSQQPPLTNQQRRMSSDSPDSMSGGAGVHSMAKIEQQVQVLTHPSLVNANEIRVQQPKIMEHAQLGGGSLTLTERLDRNDKLILNSLIDKHNLLSELLKDEKVRQFFLVSYGTFKENRFYNLYIF